MLCVRHDFEGSMVEMVWAAVQNDEYVTGRC